MKRRAFLGLGASSIGVGTLYGTGAFSSVSAGRGISVNAANDASALLGIEGTAADTTPSFTNNTAKFTMDVTLDSNDNIEFDVNGDGTFETPPVSFDITAEDTRDVELGGTDEEALVDITADLTNGNNENIGSIVLNRVFEIPQTAAIRDVEGTVSNAGNSGKYDFNLENTQPAGGQTAELDGIRVDAVLDENTDATRVGGQEENDPVFVLVDEGSIVNVQEIVIGDDTIADFVRDGSEDEVTLAPGEQESFSFERFRQDPETVNGNGNTQTGVEDIDITLRAADGSTAMIELRAA